MLHPPRYRGQRTTQGRSDWLGLLRRTLSFLTPSRFIPALSLDQQLTKRADASDVVQETQLRISNHIETFRGSTEAEFSGWAREILINVINTHIREHKEAQRRSIYREESPASGTGSASLSWHHFVESNGRRNTPEVILGERALALAAAIEQLSPLQQDAVRMRYLQGETVSVIAERLETNVDAVSSAIYRGLKNLRAKLAQYDPKVES